MYRYCHNACQYFKHVNTLTNHLGQTFYAVEKPNGELLCITPKHIEALL